MSVEQTGTVVAGPWTPTIEPADTVEVAPAAPVMTGEVLPATRPAALPARTRIADPIRLPAWATSRTVARATAQHSARVAGRVAVRSSWRAPEAVARGSWRAGRFWWSWVRAEDLADELRDSDNGKLGKEIFVVRDHRKVRWYITGGALGGSSLAEAIGAVMVGEWVPALTGVVAISAAGIAGRRRRAAGEPLVDGIERETKADLAPAHLNDAFRAAGLLKGPDMALVLRAPIVRDRLDRGWETLVDLPRGGGKTAADAIGKLPTIAAELSVDEIQLVMRRVRAHEGGHGRRLSLWVADDDPYIGTPVPSLLIDLERFDFWKAVPFGQDARGNRVDILLLWQSAFFGGLPRRGKTFSMRLLVAAAILDPWCQLWLADGKGGADFRAVAQVAHRYVSGADPDDLEAFEAMLDALISEMSRRFALLASLPATICPEGKLTPQIMRKYNLPLIPCVIDELQEYFEAVEEEKDRQRIIGKLARVARRGPAAGIMPMYASQRPDAKSVPTKLREIVTYRYSTQVTDKTSSDMVLGDGKARAGADASILSEEHKGVGVLVTGPASFVTVKADLLENPEFEVICQRGRALRLAEGTLTGQACGDIGAAAGAVGYAIPPLIGDVMEAFGQRSRMWTDDLLAALVNLDEDTYGEWDGTILAAELDDAGVVRTTKQVKIDGANRAGWLLRDIEGAIPPEVLAARPAARPVEGAPSTPTAG
ncbi:FtsK/SpoIIIE domain-containing protein [Candidatus Frankia nodulisporulans]|uniref:FtsK/SpoIIIE domain-containing protein n=1 Tax=Candidatus Frankia nodulisporulans TaxID=2060052 RepID=UPI001CDD7175|nr:FtsK/SpoIIIE domain-containing protein [Candidatus Frankia nodulisporulans]